MNPNALLSEADFITMPRKGGDKYELSEGKLVVTAGPRLFHALVRDRLGVSLAAYCRALQLGEVIWEIEFHLAAYVIRIPDLAFLTASHLRGIQVREQLEGAPDLAIEVVTGACDASDLARKVQQYLRAGAAQIWVLYPETRLMYAYSQDRVEIREDGQALDAPTLFPGWSFNLTELFNAAGVQA